MIPCPKCGFAGHRVIESRYQLKAQAKRRRCECKACGRRFNTQEQVWTGRLAPGPEPKPRPAAPPSQEAIWLARLDRFEASLAELQEQLHKVAAPAQPVASGHPPEGPAMPTASMPIEELGLPARAYNGLKRARINTVGDLLHYAPADLLEIRQFGTTSLDDVVWALDWLGLGLELRGAGS